MKKVLLVLSICIFFASPMQTEISCAQNKQTCFAKVESNNTYLCSSPSENSSVFEIPFSYFVEVQYKVDDYYKVSYKDVEGYVKKDKITLMNGTPINPYASATVGLFAAFGLYESPNKTSKIKTQLADGTEGLTYYGSKVGQQLGAGNNTWYYCSIQQNAAQYFGYIFSGITDGHSSFPTNTETFEVVGDEILEGAGVEFNKLSTSTKIMLIVSISIPSLLILYFLIKPSRIMQVSKNRKQIKKENKKVRHGDYFEFNENDL